MIKGRPIVLPRIWYPTFPCLNFRFAENFTVTILERIGENFFAKYSLIFHADCCEHRDCTKAECFFGWCQTINKKCIATNCTLRHWFHYAKKNTENCNQAINSTNSNTSSMEKAMCRWAERAWVLEKRGYGDVASRLFEWKLSFESSKGKRESK